VSPASGLSIAAIPVVLAGLVSGWILLRAARTAGRRDRVALTLIAVAAAVMAGGVLASAAWLTQSDPVARAEHMLPAAIGLGVGSLALAAALVLHVDHGPGGRRAALRRWADGVLIAACAAYVLWSLFVGPNAFDYLGRPADETLKALGAAALAPVLLGIGVSVTLVFRGWRRQPYPTAGAITYALIWGGALVVAAGISGAWPTIVFGVAFGLALVAIAVVARDPAVRANATAGHHATWLGLVPLSCAIAACAIRLAIYHNSDNTSSVIAVVIGASLGLRQTLAMRDVRAYAAEVESREARFRRLAHTDPLTGLGNRRYFWDALERQAAAGGPATLVCIDLDRFKAINDVWGHDVGDALLVEVAHRLRANLRTGDVAARLGGDEFAVLLALPPTDARTAADRLAAVLAAPYALAERRFAMSASIGLVGYTAGDFDILMRHADMALRFAKLRGRNRTEDYETAYSQWLRRRTAVEEGLRGAVDRDEMALAYQPIVTVPAGRTVGVEALLCWRHPALGVLRPAEFMPVAEDCGLGDDIARWALHEACRQLSRWLADGHDVWVAVDMSVRELRRSDFAGALASAMRTHHVPPGRLMVEVDEHEAALEAVDIADRLGAIRDVGARVALDSVGGGLSVLGRLHEVPVDALKISRTLMREVAPARVLAPSRVGVPVQRAPIDQPNQRSAMPLVDAIVRVGASLDLDVIALGVADSHCRGLVQAAGCRLAQGAAFGPPMPAEHVDALLSAQAPAPGRSAWPSMLAHSDGLDSLQEPR
jgi:diguanylate cyclase (GGDEF)-like protein